MLAGCRKSATEKIENIDRLPDIFPDYTYVTIPENIAPLNFRINEECRRILVTITGRHHSISINARGNKAIIPSGKWSKLLKESAGDSLEIVVKTVNNGTLKNFKPFRIFVKEDLIDDYLVYRLLMPGFQNWNQMGIYERATGSFRTRTIADSKVLPGTCMNCHSFALNDPQNMVMHLRESYGGTILFRNNKLEKLNTKAGRMFGNAAFPSWHPSGKFIAFSVNRVNQVFHALGNARAAAIDMKSDIFVYDIDKNEMLTSPLISAEENFESFPCFSPDGKKLYFCSARSVKMPEKFDSIKYSLCSVDFDASSASFGEKTDTLISGPEMNKSISIPRVSPDNHFLMFNVTDYGCFPSYNPEADLWLLNLDSGQYGPLEPLNSSNTESYHSWSLNSRWAVFTSRRGDGLYSKPYIGYIDRSGKAAKPFLLPQKDPDFYDSFMFSFNVPELVRAKVPVSVYEIEKVAKRTPAVQVTTDSGH
jgi:hypothetical protein